MKTRLQPLVWSSIRGRELYQALTKFHVLGHGRHNKCPGCKLERQMERQMFWSSETLHR